LGLFLLVPLLMLFMHVIMPDEILGKGMYRKPRMKYDKYVSRHLIGYQMRSDNSNITKVAVVLFVTRSQVETLEQSKYLLDDGTVGKTTVQRPCLGEDRSNNHTVTVHCEFPKKIDAEWISINSFRVPVKQMPFNSPSGGNSLCIPTLFGAWCSSEFFKKWILAYVRHYNTHFDIKYVRFYTDDPSCFNHLSEFEISNTYTEVILLSGENIGAHYHNQRLSNFDCFYRSLQDNTNWVLTVDIDEILYPSNVFESVGSDVTTISFASWRYSAGQKGYIGANCDDAEARIHDPYSESPRGCGKFGDVSPCCSCSLSFIGRRKYAIRADFDGDAPNCIHDPSTRNGKIFHLDALFNTFLRHYDLQSGRQNKTLARKIVQDLERLTPSDTRIKRELRQC
jgi:hypothetical protein